MMFIGHNRQMDPDREKIRRFIADKFSFNDYLSVSSYFKKEELNDGLKKIMEEDWQETGNDASNPERISQILDHLHQQIGKNSHSKSNIAHPFYRLFSKIATVLILPAFIALSILTYFSIRPSGVAESWAEIHSPVGSRTKFQLPDGSQGWLNSGSSIKYPISFLKNRHVEISGEVWFDVAHLNAEDFRVITPYFDIKVLGTQFNVVSYANESTAEVILERGKIVLLDKLNQVSSELHPDQKIVYSKSSGKIVKSNVDSKSYTSWKDGLLKFRNEPMSEIARRLERKYNTEIILHGDTLKSSVFRATFQDENLDEICRMISTVAPIHYKIHQREKLPDNTFTKSKVELWLKSNINLK